MFKFIHAKTTADIVDPSTTLGIEITVPEIAALCGLGNVDGQHGMVATSEAWRGKAAIEIALDCDLPLDGAALVTSRPDLDSIGAMAILVLRSLGLAEHIDRELVAAIAAADSFRPPAKWEPRPLPTEKHPWPSGQTTVDSSSKIAHLGMICSPRRGDLAESWSLADRVFVIAWALQAKSIEYICTSQTMDRRALMEPIAAACGSTANIDADHWLALVYGAVHDSRRMLARAAHIPGALVDRGSFVEVRVERAGAFSLGYCLRPVVAAFDQANRGKVTIAAYADGHLDAKRLCEYLTDLEFADHPWWREQLADMTLGPVVSHGELPVKCIAVPTDRDGKPVTAPQWGGPRNMCSSPQVPGGTRLSEQTIADAVARFTKAEVAL